MALNLGICAMCAQCRDIVATLRTRICLYHMHDIFITMCLLQYKVFRGRRKETGGTLCMIQNASYKILWTKFGRINFNDFDIDFILLQLIVGSSYKNVDMMIPVN